MSKEEVNEYQKLGFNWYKHPILDKEKVKYSDEEKAVVYKDILEAATDNDEKTNKSPYKMIDSFVKKTASSIKLEDVSEEAIKQIYADLEEQMQKGAICRPERGTILNYIFYDLYTDRVQGAVSKGFCPREIEEKRKERGFYWRKIDLTTAISYR